MNDTDNNNINKNTENQNAPIDGDIVISVNPSCSEAYMTIYAPFNGGKAVTFEQAKQALEKNGVVFGIIESAIKETILSNNYEKNVLVAKWQPPVDGQDGAIKYLYDRSRELKPSEKEHGFVDYKDLGLINNITKGSVIAEISLPTEGTPGIDLKGISVPQRPGKKAVFSVGPNTKLNDDETKIIAVIDGNLVYKGGAFTIEDVVTIRGDVDSSTGNIDFLGNVIIKGEVCEGFKVTSKQNITVMGNVNGATIEAIGNVEIKKGCINSTVISQGDVTIGFCEHSKITCKGSLTAQTFVICDVYCGGNLSAKNAHGSIMGGKYTSLKGFEAQNIGSKTYTPTEIIVGDNAVLTKEKEQLDKQIQSIDQQILRCTQIVDFLNEKKKILHNLSKDKEELLGSTVRTKVMLGMDKKKLQKRVAEIEAALQVKQHLSVQCKGTVYPGVKVVINDCIYRFENEYKYVKIYLDEDGQIVTAPL
jgi:uncharacterized protein (DUF342 family)